MSAFGARQARQGLPDRVAGIAHHPVSESVGAKERRTRRLPAALPGARAFRRCCYGHRAWRNRPYHQFVPIGHSEGVT
jgi:hypothetical protein